LTQLGPDSPFSCDKGEVFRGPHLEIERRHLRKIADAFLTSNGASRTSKPATVAVPELGGRKHVSILMVVVLPAPFGPRKRRSGLLLTSKENLVNDRVASVPLGEIL